MRPTLAPASVPRSAATKPPESATSLERALAYPRLRFMGSKHGLLPFLHEVLCELHFDTALDAFSGSGAVAYLLKSMGAEVTTNDFLHFPATIARATVQNAGETLAPRRVEALCRESSGHARFIEETFQGIFYTRDDLRFLDRVWGHLARLRKPERRALALAALIRACVKRQPRGVFTVAGDPARYKDGRRDLRLSLESHFREQVAVYNACVFDNGRQNRAGHGDVFEVDPVGFDLVYLDPPYVPRADDNCYVKRYHFLEGLSRYWQGMEIQPESRVKKLVKPYTPFSYRREAGDAFARLFAHFEASTLVLSYSSNGYPDLDELEHLLRRTHPRVQVHERAHRYHFGTHRGVRRAKVREYLIVGRR